MTTITTTLSTASGNVNVPIRKPGPAEQAFSSKYDAGFASSKNAIALDASNDWLYRSGGAGDAPSSFLLIDRIGGTRFASGKTSRHPIVVQDELTGKPCLMFGAGGTGANVLTTSANGDIEQPSILSGGVEINRMPLFSPGLGCSIMLALRIPRPGDTANGNIFGTQVGGISLGGGADNADGTSAQFGFNQGNGTFRGCSQDDSASQIVDTVDHRDGTWTKLVLTFDTTKTFRLWFGSSTSAPITASATKDFSSTSANAKYPRIGAFGLTAAFGRFIGFIAVARAYASPFLNDDAARAAAFALLTEKTM